MSAMDEMNGVFRAKIVGISRNQDPVMSNGRSSITLDFKASNGRRFNTTYRAYKLEYQVGQEVTIKVVNNFVVSFGDEPLAPPAPDVNTNPDTWKPIY